MLATLFLIVAAQVGPAATEGRTVQRTVPSRSAQIRVGRQVAVMNCQTCHAIGRTGLSANVSAPQFRYLSRKYPIDNLAEAFAEGVLVGHSVMPQFEFAPDQVTGLMAYLKSIQVPQRPHRAKRVQ